MTSGSYAVTPIVSPAYIVTSNTCGANLTLANNVDAACTVKYELRVPNLELTKSAPNPSLVVGVTSEYTLSVTNNGTGPATSATIQDQLPIGMDYESSTGTNWACTNNSGLLTCTYSGTIAAAGTAEVKIRAKPAPTIASPAINHASIDTTGGTAPPLPGAACAGAGCTTESGGGSTVGRGINLTLAKAAPSPTLAVGRSSSYVLTVTNSGTGPATSATIQDQLPSGMDYESSTGANWVCINNSGLLTCTFTGTIAASGGTQALTLQVKPTPTIASPAINRASIDTTGGTNPPLPGPACSATGCTTESGGGTTTVGNGIDLTLAKGAPSPALAVGRLSSYVLTVTNNGTGPAPRATVKDQLPNGMGYDSFTGTNWSCANSSGLVTCTFTGTIAANGGTQALTIKVKPTLALASPAINHASIDPTGGINPPAPGAACTGPGCTTESGGGSTVGSGIELTLTKGAPSPALAVGRLSNYALTVTNAGTGAATSATIKDQLPGGMDYESFTGTNWSCINSSGLLTCTYAGTIAGGGVAQTLTIKVKPTPTMVSPAINHASIDPTGGTNPPIPGPSCSGAGCTTESGGGSTVGSGINLTLTKGAPSPALAVGRLSSYVLTVANTGTGPAASATIKDQLPAGMGYESSTGTNWGCANNSGLLTCTYTGTIAAGSGAPTLTLQVKPTPALASPAINYASIDPTGGTTPPVPGPACGGAGTGCTTESGGGSTVGSGINLTLAKSAPTPALAVGRSSSYVLTVTNTGTGDAASATIKDRLPGGMDYELFTGTNWGCINSSGLLTCTYTGTIAAGGSAPTLTIQVKPTPTMASPAINYASIDPSGGTNPPIPGLSCSGAGCTTESGGGTTVSSGVSLALAKGAPTPALAVGHSSSYVLTVTNNGTGPATSATIKDQLPGGMDYESSTGTNWSCINSSGLLTCTYAGTIAAGAAAQALTLQVKPTIAIVSPAINHASIDTTGGTNPPVPGSGCGAAAGCTTDGTTGVVGSGGALTLAIAAAAPPFAVGQQSGHVLKVTNTGVGIASRASVRSQLPPGLQYVSVSGAGWTCTESGGLVTCDFIGAIAGGGISEFTLNVIPRIPMSGATVVNYASIDPTGGSSPPIPGPACTGAACTTDGGSTGALQNLSLTKSAPSPALTVGLNSAYTLTVTNSGSELAPTATVKDQLPAGMSYVSATGANWTCADNNGLVTCNFVGAIAIAGKAAVNLTVIPKPEAAGNPVINYASIDKTGGASPPTPGAGCTDPGCTVGEGGPHVIGGGTDLYIEKTANKAEASIGEIVLYRLKVTNPGLGVATNVKVEDRLPLGFRYIPGTTRVRNAKGAATAIADSGDAKLSRVIPIGNIAAKGAVELSYRVRVGIGAQRGNGTNSARAFAANGPQSRVATAKVKVTGGVFTTDACILGKVYTDCNGNRRQDAGEVGIPKVRLYLEDGTNMTTDANGNYSICGVRPLTHVMKIDRSSLPAGATPLISSNRNSGDQDSLFVDLKNGEFHRADFLIDACTAEQKKAIRTLRSTEEKAANDRRKSNYDFKFKSN
ncbi:hypothetical protein RGU70_10780 [Herbaspirillum sp. RTI4]|uniref:hypothetical protein n=1 Tax=Herbaspirillum sp. RTI4 TaxID=3048640 RepID=UPI002AB3763F|nr:hypothetical protein [Herbaspirillum sp. RTI4]MDY7578804.1 hypothetical protein [Herbaspirillum sp. RTI4]MEA9983427.1 hypothetical protein [Herbaspirillum sp. RTI4]